MKKALAVLLLITLSLIALRARYHLPPLLYNAIPYIYVLSAVIAFALIQHPLSAATGVVLGVAGVWVFNMRATS